MSVTHIQIGQKSPQELGKDKVSRDSIMLPALDAAAVAAVAAAAAAATASASSSSDSAQLDYKRERSSTASTYRQSIDTTTFEKSHLEKSDNTQRTIADDASSSYARNSMSASSRRTHREVRFGAYVLGSTLGEGEFGKVKLGWRKDGQYPSQVAIKLIKRDTLARGSELEIKIHREINSMRLLSHPNIVNLVEVLKSGKYIGIVLEYASGGELFEYILQHKHLKENAAKRLFAQLVSGVDYMHLKGLIHRDLKLENLLLDKHKNIVISDFGFVNSYSRAKNDLMKTSCGLPCYAAPELVLTRTPYSGRKVDIWSMGVILYAMLAGYLPFDDDSENEDGSDIVRLYNYICSTRLTFPEYVSPLARDLLRRIIVPDPNRRIGIDEIRNHPWLALHASLLAIRQPEWDRMAQDEKLSGLNTVAAAQYDQNRNKRYSMISEPTNLSALMLSSSKNTYGKSYASSSNIIYSNPTTSSSFANVVVTGADSKRESINGVSQNTAVGYNLPASNSENYSYTTGTQSSSSGTFKKGHLKSASLSTTHTSASNALKAVVSEHDRSADEHFVPQTSSFQVSRNSSYAGAIPTISESSTASEFSRVPRALPTPVERLPHTQKRPRPTSYHPGSMSLSFILYNNSTSTVLDFVVGTAQSPNYPYSQYLLSSPSRGQHGIESSMSVSDNSHVSPVLLATASTHKASRRDSVVTAINVNGVLSSEISTHENDRNLVLSYLEDKMEALELSELHSPTRIPIDDSDLPTIKNIPQIPKLQTELPQPGKNTPIIDQLPMFAVPTESPIIASTESLSLSKVQDSDAQQGALKETTISLKSKDMDENREESKESKEAKDQKKKNRFSILSFYGTSSYSSYNVANEGNSEGSIKGTVASKDSKNSATSGETSSDMKERRRVETAGSENLLVRKPMRTISQNTNASTVTAKEASAARKVMNFFKRRSVRIG